MSEAEQIALTAMFAAIVAIAGTVAVERLGGRIGGILHTVPTTIVPASIGMYAGGHDRFVAAMCAVPLGMLVDAGFLWTWRALPPKLPGRALGPRLAMMLLASLGVWSAGAVVLVTGLHALHGDAEAGLLAGMLGLLALAIVGVLSCLGAPPAPRAHRRPSPLALASRGVLAATAIGLCVWITHHGDPVAGGLASAFPAMFTTTMVSLWVVQGEAIPTGAVGPMILGSTSVGVYALLGSAVLPLVGPWLGVPLCWIGAVLTTSVPAGLWLTRSRVTRRRPLPATP